MWCFNSAPGLVRPYVLRFGPAAWPATADPSAVRSSPGVASPLRPSAGNLCESTASSWGAALPPHRPGIACRFPQPSSESRSPACHNPVFDPGPLPRCRSGGTPFTAGSCTCGRSPRRLHRIRPAAWIALFLWLCYTAPTSPGSTPTSPRDPSPPLRNFYVSRVTS
jgi:hypothetical protein